MRISSKLRWLILIIIACTSLSVALVGYFGHSAVISDLQAEVLQKRAALELDRLELAFVELNHDVSFLANLPLVKRFANARLGAGTHSESAAKDDLAAIFEQMLRAKEDYAQIRLIPVANNGMELVRVDRNDGDVFRVSEEQLQMKGGRDYFIKASQKSAGEIYHSRINLNRENDIVELPIRPVLRVAMPIYGDSGDFYGIVIVNLNFQAFINRVFREGLDRSRYQYYLLNEDGYFLLNPEPLFTFGFDMGFEMKVENEFPEMAGFSESSEDSITFRRDALSGASGQLIHFKKFTIFDSHRELVFGIVGSYDDIGRASLFITSKILVAMCLITLTSLCLAIRFSSQLTRPLERITIATRNLASNQDYCHQLPVDRDDEIGDLANTFQEMKSSIEKHRSQLMRANHRLLAMNRDLEHFAHVASHDLREPIQRIAGLASLYESECGDGSAKVSTDVLKQLHLECDKALVQLADFREFTEITRDSSLKREETPIEEVVSATLKEFSEPLELRRIRVEIDPLPVLSSYRNLVHVLYRNLVGNALKHTREDGFMLHFTCELDAAGNTCLGVRNSGSSVHKGDSDVVFDLFRKLDVNSVGNGIGLAISKRIVDFHSGRIWVESDVNHFHIKFILSEYN